jgi:hypothetical protein
MPPWKSPEMGSSDMLKFVRDHRNIAIGHFPTRHTEIAATDGLAAAIQKTRIEDPTEADAGMVMIAPQGTLVITDSSDTLGLPVTEYLKEAREKTIVDFKEQSPGYEVRDRF